MAEKDSIYKCEICGNVVSVIEAGKGELVCCGEPMKKLEEQTIEQEGKEKHVPIIEKSDNGIKVKIGSVPHPMEDSHFIELVQVISNDGIITGKRLKPGDLPEVEFCCINYSDDLKARIFCNVHGVWKSN
jgi:superoxide reductase